MPLEHLARHHPARQRPGRHHQGANPARRKLQPPQGGEPLHLQGAVGREVVVRQHRIGRQAEHHALSAGRGGEEEGEVACQLVRLLLAGRDGEQHPRPARADELPGQPAARGPLEPDHLGASTLRQRQAFRLVLEGEENALPGPLVGLHLQQVLAVEQDLARRHLVVRLAGDDVGEGRLAGAVRPHDRGDLARPHRQAQPVEDLLPVNGNVEVLDLKHRR